MKASIMALLIAITLVIYVYKASDHEAVSELPTVQTDVVMTQDIPPVVEAAEVVEVEAEQPTPVVAKPIANKPVVHYVEATHYTAKCDGCSGITKTGIDVRRTIYHEGMRVIAVDPSLIALNSIVHVSYPDGTAFEAIAGDVGSAIKGARIDVLVTSKKEAYRLGRKQVEVTIIKHGEGR